MAWVACVPLLLAVCGWGTHDPRRIRSRVASPRRAFLLGLAAGLVYFVGTVYWTSTVVAQFGGLPGPLAIFAMLLLSLYLALYPALAALITARLIARAGQGALLLAPAAWVTTEYFRGYLFGGFPWVPLGSSQITVLPIAQLASVLGVYGISALLVFVNAALAFAFIAHGRARILVTGSAMVLVAAVGGWGTWRVAEGTWTREGTALTVGLIQGNIAQEEKWQPQNARRILTTYLAMSRDAVRRGAGFVIWPESSTPFMFEEDTVGGRTVRDLARELQVPLLFGSDQLEKGPPPRLYNAAFLVTPGGTTAATYRKIHLVPFGEYIPFKEWLYFVSPLVDSLAEFAPGRAMVLLPVRADGATRLASTAICYEVVYPSLIRQAVLGGTELLTTITNDAWYGHSSAPYQHFAMAAMRAVEQGRYLARAANTGISGIIDPYGRVVEESGIFEQVGLVGEVRLITRRTIYGAIGDVVAYVGIAVTVLGLLVTGRRRT